MNDNLTDAISLPPVVVIDDDPDDLELLRSIGRKLKTPNELVFFSNPDSAFGYLQRTVQAPALIVCDVNMPKINGFELRTKLLSAIPFLEKVPFFFLSTSKTDSDAKSAEALQVEGFFEKTSSPEGLRTAFQSILVAAGILS